MSQRYFVRFIGEIIPALRVGTSLPPAVFEGVFVDVDSDKDLQNFVNEYSLQLLQRGGLAVLVEENIVPRSPEERKASPMPRPKGPEIAFGKRMIVPMHMITSIVPDVVPVQPQPSPRPLLPEMAAFVMPDDDEGGAPAPKDPIQ